VLKLQLCKNCATDLQLFEIYHNAIEQSNVQVKPLTQCKQSIFPSFGRRIRTRVSHLQKKWANLPVSVDSHFSCHALINVGLAKLWIMVCRRWSLLMPPVLPAYRTVHFPPVPRATESTSTSHQFRSGTGSSTIVYIHTPEGESVAQFS
jgi:hypothetical protein